MKTLKQALTAAIFACVLCAGHAATAFEPQKKGDQKPRPDKEKAEIVNKEKDKKDDRKNDQDKKRP